MYLHLFTDSQFIDTIVRHCDEVSQQNRYIVFAKGNKSKFSQYNNLEFYSSYKEFKKTDFRVENYKRVFIHYLGGNAVDLILDNPDYGEYYWFFWGADGYALISEKKSVYLSKTFEMATNKRLLKDVIKSKLLKLFKPIKAKKLKALRKVKMCCTSVLHDYYLICESTGCTMNHLFFSYMSTDDLFKNVANLSLNTDFSGTLNIQIGNSLNHTNNHIEAIDFVHAILIDRPVNVTIPTSYAGQEGYKNALKAYATSHLKSVTFLDKFLPYDEYVETLKNLDIAIFYHIRQQGANNALVLLWLGKILIMRAESTLFMTFRSWGLSVMGHDEILSFDDIMKFNNLHSDRLYRNREILNKYISPGEVKKQYESLYKD